MSYKHYLFDFDGTLVDSMPTYVRAMLRVLDERGIAYGGDLVRTITPLGYLGTARYYIRELGLAMPEEEAVAAMKAYAYDGYAHHVAAKEGVSEALCALRAAGATLHILTASPHEVLDVCLTRLGLAPLFTDIWSCDDFGTTKADPEIYRMAAARIGAPVSEILFLDDNENACKTAAAAGMPVCGVYDATSADREAALRAVAGRYIHSFSELL